MLEKYLTDGNVIACTVVPAADGDELLMFPSHDGRHFLKSSDHFRTVNESWITPVGTVTANANLLRIRDGRLMMPVKLPSPVERIAALGGADFAVLFSRDDGHTFGDTVQVNRGNGCYYLMNQRILRTHTGRILLPICKVPNELLDQPLETVGWVGCFYSDDEGQSWQEGAWIRGESIDQHLAEPFVVQGRDDRLHMYMRTGVGYLYHAVSEDDGANWTPEEPTPLRSPCAPFCVQYDPYADRFLAVWDNSFPAPVHQYPRTPICLAESADGVSWRMICELDNDPMRGYGYPTIVPYAEEILITYYESPQRSFHLQEHKLKLKLLSRAEITK